MNRRVLNLENYLNVIPVTDCSHEENICFTKLLKEEKPLPDGVYPFHTEEGELFYDVNDPDVIMFYRREEVSETERTELVLLKTYEALKTIKGCVIFFTVLIVLNLLAEIIMGFNIASIF